MENNFVNIKLKKFIYYLNNIGLLPKECNCQIINIFYQLGNIYLNTNEILKSNIDYINRTFKENIIKTLSVFLNSLTKEQNNIISLNIYHNYTNKENLLNIEKAYIFNKLFIKLKLKRAFHKIFFFSKENHNYNFLYRLIQLYQIIHAIIQIIKIKFKNSKKFKYIRETQIIIVK